MDYQTFQSMDGQTIASLLIVNLMLTIFVYLLVPVILVIIGKKYTQSQIKKITIINGIVCFILFTIIENETAGVGPLVLWSWAAYWILNKKCLVNTQNQPALEKTEEHPQKSTKFCRYCGSKISYDSVFCSYCGGKVGKSEVSEKE